ncbi:rod shape-determining protein [Parasporobacterium paucivorans]|uniref:Cell shape-determining protein MreB n=1 Tax=Parasporobacterium paucivorans DSM 15970 TaxID=1122934 RepID=A0A1M6A2M5_9FIRM|nr:rod shape-determining protein [Parasporobacterium paucivorans]SHI30658.1 rod shape-determining protein MreB [Parasporobacterium paucivorans DSM 15970]
MIQNNYGLDLGTSNIKIFSSANDRIINEKNVIAIKDKNTIISFGDEAYEMYEKNPPYIRVISPIQNGVIADINNMKALFESFYRKINDNRHVSGSSFCIAAPTDITSVEKWAFYNLIVSSSIKAKNITMVEKPIADAVGVGIDINCPQGNLIVNIASDTTEISVVSLGGIVLSKIIQIAGKKFDENIVAEVRKKHGLIIGSKTAEQIKIKLGNAYGESGETMSVYGRHVVSGLPVKALIESSLVNDAIQEYLRSIIDSVKAILERTPPELSADIIDTGIYITGGSANIRNIDKLFTKETGLKVNLVDNPAESIIRGIRTILTQPGYSSVQYVPKAKEYD